MSITIRLWSDEDLKNLKTNKKLLTILFNTKTFSQKELEYFYKYYNDRMHFIFNTSYNNVNFITDIYATRLKEAIWFFKQEYRDEEIISIMYRKTIDQYYGKKTINQIIKMQKGGK